MTDRRRQTALALMLAPLVVLGCKDQGTGPALDTLKAAVVEISPTRVFLTEETQWDLSSAAYTKGGLPTSRPVTWSTSDARVATVDDKGLVTAVAPGSVTVTARLDGASGTASVTVVEDLASLPIRFERAPEVEPGTLWRLQGEGLGDLVVRIGGVAVAVEVVSDTLALIQVPSLDPSRPCLPPSLLVVLQTSEWAAAMSAPGRAPLELEISPGHRVSLDPAVQHGCEIVAPPGDYLIAAVVPDDPAAMREGRLVPDSVTLDLWSQDPSAPRFHQEPEGPISAPMLEPLDLLPRAPEPLAPWAASSENSASCQTPTSVGDSVLLPTGRDEQGRYDWGAPTTDEWWYLVAQTPHLNLEVDSAGARIWAADSYVRAELSSVMEMYEDEWVPIWEELYEDPLPDRDGNGRMIMRSAWNSAVGGGGGIGTYAQSDCSGGWRAGEDFYVPMDVFSDDPARAPWYLRAFHRTVVQHEAGHTHDLARRYGTWGGHTFTSQVAAEGIASFSTTYWLLKKQTSPLVGNHRPSDVAVLLDQLMFETDAWKLFPDISNTYDWTAWAEAGGYGQSVQFITWVAAQAVLAGKPVSSVLTGLVHASDARTTYGSIFRDATGEQASDEEVLVRWGLSWIVDDWMENPPPELTIPTWNTEAAYEEDPSASRPGPTAVLDGATGAVLELAEPDIALISLVGPGPHRFGISITGNGGANGLHVQILRTR